MKKSILGVIAIVGIAFALVSFVHQNSRHLDSRTLKVGVISYLTGSVAQIGNDYLRGIELAAKRFNIEHDDLSITLVVEDGKNSAKDAVSAFNKLLMNDVSIVLMVGDNHVNSTAPIAKKRRMPILATMTGSTEFLKHNKEEPYIFLDWITIDLISSRLAQCAKNDLQLNKIGLLTLEDEYGKEAAIEFKKVYEGLGGKVIAAETYGFESKDLGPQVTKLLSLKPNAIFVVGYGGAYISAINKLKELKFNGTILTDTSIMNPESKEGVVEFSNIVYADSIYNDEPESDRKRQFVRNYKEEYGHVPSLFSAFGYDSLYIVAQIVENSENVDSRFLQNRLLSVQNLRTLNGDVSTTKTGAMVMPLVLRKLNSKGEVIEILK